MNLLACLVQVIPPPGAISPTRVRRHGRVLRPAGNATPKTPGTHTASSFKAVMDRVNVPHPQERVRGTESKRELITGISNSVNRTRWPMCYLRIEMVRPALLPAAWNQSQLPVLNTSVLFRKAIRCLRSVGECTEPT